MPSLARKVIICAALEGIVVIPKDQRAQRAPPLYRIKYGDSSITPVSKDAAPDTSEPNSSFEAFGIIGPLPSWTLRHSYIELTLRRRI